MRKRIPSNIRFLSGICLLLLVFLLMTTAVQAQSEEDSTVMIEEAIPPPQEMADDEAEESSEDGLKEERFIPVGDRDSLQITRRQLPPGYARRLAGEDDFWYANADIEKKNEEKKEKDFDPSYTPFMQRSWVQTLLWIIIVAGFVGAIIFYLVDSNVGLFRKKKVPLPQGTEENGELPEDIFAINYQKELDRAVAAGNYRLATRLMFLRLLRKLSERQLISYKHDKTNLDYLMELSSKTWYPVFFRLTRHFEYSWYGHFEVGEEAYRIIAAEFNEFEKQV